MKISKNSSQSGFSLVELMVVVAIIGILATVAIPRVNKFIAKARTSEAQVNLSSIYTLNKNFFVEFQGYVNDFGAIGYVPEGRLRYNVGWNQPASTGTAPNYAASLKVNNGTFKTMSSTLVACGTAAPTATKPCQTMVGADGANPPPIVGSQISATAFLIGAGAVLVSSGGTVQADTWTMSDSKVLNNTNDGTN